ncbi:hypothetical protein K470DRAFT_201856, partial [Piedraia hortae CBS 480.64]
MSAENDLADAIPTKKDRWRWILGLSLLSVTIFLWTTSNFLASTIFADDSYSKPFFVTCVNSSCFIGALLPLLRRRQRPVEYARSEAEDRLLESSESEQESDSPKKTSLPLTLRETGRLALEFCPLWFLANYFAAACLEYTTVASATILTSTSSVFTLIFGALFGAEAITLRKVLAVLASLAGVALISTADLSGNNAKEHRGDFPAKTKGEIAIGDTLALISAVMYGLYAVFLKKRIPDESRISMPTFFGFVGLFGVILLWPGFFVLHFCGIEPFQLPPTTRIWTIILLNSLASLCSDMAWAYAVLLTSPIVVTLGLSMTIPLSLVGQIVINSQTVSLLYWIGAAVVVVSFVFV